MKNNILLESGTGEVELLEFSIDNTHYVINVLKVKEIIEVDCVTKLPEMPNEIDGLILVREDIVTIIDLKYIFTKKKLEDNNFETILCEFNKVKVAFKIEKIVGTHRVKWEQIMKPDNIIENSSIIGSILLNNKIVWLLDFEAIVTNISPNTGISENRIIDVVCKDRKGSKIVLADDSALIRRLMKETLTKAGFENLKFFDDGKQCLDYLNSLIEKKNTAFVEDVDVLITDIEMPQMDGHTLTRKIKEHPILKRLPVIIFSSLISDELRHKGKIVGANEQLSKPEIGELVALIDKYTEK